MADNKIIPGKAHRHYHAWDRLLLRLRYLRPSVFKRRKWVWDVTRVQSALGQYVCIDTSVIKSVPRSIFSAFVLQYFYWRTKFSQINRDSYRNHHFMSCNFSVPLLFFYTFKIMFRILRRKNEREIRRIERKDSCKLYIFFFTFFTHRIRRWIQYISVRVRNVCNSTLFISRSKLCKNIFSKLRKLLAGRKEKERISWSYARTH